MNKEIFGFWERLYALAKQKKLPIKRACEEKKLSYHALTTAKCDGREYPTLSTIIALAGYYSTSLDYLILGKTTQVNTGLNSADEEMIIKEYRSLDDFHKARIYTAILDAKQDMFAQRLKKESSTSGSMVG